MAEQLDPEVNGKSKSKPDETPHYSKACFIIMPYGVKEHPITKENIDFEVTYTNLIEPVLKKLNLKYDRSDKAPGAGLIHSQMIDNIISDDVAIVDITMGNPNVMYELGVRHSAKRSGTVIIKRAGDKIPFNIGGVRVFEYPAKGDCQDLEHFKKRLETGVKEALTSGQVDSLVHGLFRGLNVTKRANPIAKQETFVYRWRGEEEVEGAKEICIITGDIMDVETADIWVNPENVKMQMGRFYDSSVSAGIRYSGAKHDKKGHVTRDDIAEMLARRMWPRSSVEPGSVIITPSGSLRRQNNVKSIFHVAAQHGEPYNGYVTIRNASGCITNCLKKADNYNRGLLSPLRYSARYDSILFPLFGVRDSELIPEQTAFSLVQAAKLYFERCSWSGLERVYFLAYTDIDKALCEGAFHRLGLKLHDTESRIPIKRSRKRCQKRR